VGTAVSRLGVLAGTGFRSAFAVGRPNGEKEEYL
jgi:hypothetical protein